MSTRYYLGSRGFVVEEDHRSISDFTDSKMIRLLGRAELHLIRKQKSIECCSSDVTANAEVDHSFGEEDEVLDETSPLREAQVFRGKQRSICVKRFILWSYEHVLLDRRSFVETAT